MYCYVDIKKYKNKLVYISILFYVFVIYMYNNYNNY